MTPYGLLRVELCAIETVDATEHVYHDFCFVGIDLVGYIRFLAELRWEEDHAMFLQEVIKRHLLMGGYRTVPLPTGVDKVRVPVSPGGRTSGSETRLSPGAFFPDGEVCR